MRNLKIYESDSGYITVRPHLGSDDGLMYVTIASGSGKHVNINADAILDTIKMLQGIISDKSWVNKKEKRQFTGEYLVMCAIEIYDQTTTTFEYSLNDDEYIQLGDIVKSLADFGEKIQKGKK